VHDSSHFWQVQIIVVMQLCMYVHVLILCCAKQKGEDGPVLHNESTKVYAVLYYIPHPSWGSYHSQQLTV
jgi:hypothetical protein